MLKSYIGIFLLPIHKKQATVCWYILASYIGIFILSHHASLHFPLISLRTHLSHSLSGLYKLVNVADPWSSTHPHLSHSLSGLSSSSTSPTHKARLILIHDVTEASSFTAADQPHSPSPSTSDPRRHRSSLYSLYCDWVFFFFF